jgi:alkylated DNA repair dioxygenase AlkB
MSRLPLFESAEDVLVDDVSGRIVYRPRFVDAATAAAWFRELRARVAWKAQRRWMYDREVDVPRLTAHFELASTESSEAPEPAPPPAILEAARRVRQASGVPFNSVGLNLYRDGQDSVAPHNDHLYEITAGFPILLVSLGATRRMTIRSKEPPRRVRLLDLDAGSLLTMSYESQLHYTHGVPKTREPVGERISLAFRVRPLETSRRSTVYR